MALNPKITDKIRKKADDAFLKRNLLLLLNKVDEGRQPKRVIEGIIREIK